MSALLATLESWWCLGRLAGFRGKLNAQPEPKEPTIRAKVRELCPAAEPGWKEPCNAKVCALWRPKHGGGGKGNFGKAPSSTWKTNTSSCTMWAVCSEAESSLKVLYMTSISAMEMTPLNIAYISKLCLIFLPDVISVVSCRLHAHSLLCNEASGKNWTFLPQ